MRINLSLLGKQHITSFCIRRSDLDWNLFSLYTKCRFSWRNPSKNIYGWKICRPCLRVRTCDSCPAAGSVQIQPMAKSISYAQPQIRIEIAFIHRCPRSKRSANDQHWQVVIQNRKIREEPSSQNTIHRRMMATICTIKLYTACTQLTESECFCLTHSQKNPRKAGAYSQRLTSRRCQPPFRGLCDLLIQQVVSISGCWMLKRTFLTS